MGEKGVGKLSQETPPPREGEPMGVRKFQIHEIDLVPNYEVPTYTPVLNLSEGITPDAHA